MLSGGALGAACHSKLPPQAPGQPACPLLTHRVEKISNTTAAVESMSLLKRKTFNKIPQHCCYQEKLIFPSYNAKLILTLYSFANPITDAYSD